jgi:hypothetical protein
VFDMGMSIRTKNILTAALAVVLVGGFIFLAEGLKKDNKDDRLAAIENVTTTTVRRTTTTREPTTTTSTTALAVTTTTGAPAAVTTTTARKTTTTKVTTKKTTTTAATSAPVPHNGAGTESSDNTATFTRNGDGSYSTTVAPPCPESERTDPFCFHVGSTGSLSLEVVIRNNTSRTITFPADAQGKRALKILVTVQNPNGTSTQFVLDASSLGATLGAHEGATIKSSAAQFADAGQYSFAASCEIDYGS